MRNLPLTFDYCMYVQSKVRGRFRKILSPSQNIWTLQIYKNNGVKSFYICTMYEMEFLFQDIFFLFVIIFYWRVNICTIQLNEYQTDPYFIQWGQNITSDCVLTLLNFPEFTCFIVQNNFCSHQVQTIIHQVLDW